MAMLERQLLLTLLFGCFVQYSTGDKCTSGANGGPDWSTIDGLSISNFAGIKNHMGTLIADYEYCAVAAANRLGVTNQAMPCTIADAIDALCAAQTMRVMIEWSWASNVYTVNMVLANCIAENMRCSYYADTFMYAPTCFFEELEENAELFMSVCKTDYETVNNAPVPMAILLFADKDVRRSYVENLSQSKLDTLLSEVLKRPTMFELFDCDDKIDFMSLIEQRGVANNELQAVKQIADKFNNTGSITAIEEQDMALFLRFLPYFPSNLCQSVIDNIGEFLVTHVNFLNDVHFVCSEEDSLLYNITSSGSSALDFYAAQENITKEALSFLFEKAQFADLDAWQCSSGCAEKLVDYALSVLQSLSISNLEASLGNLVACVDDSDIESLVSSISAGSCGDLPPIIIEAANDDPVLRFVLEKCQPPNPSSLDANQIQQIGCYGICSRYNKFTHAALCTAIGTNMAWSCITDKAYCQTQPIVEYVIATCESQVSNIAVLKGAVKAYLSFEEMMASITKEEAIKFAKTLTDSGRPLAYIDAMIEQSIDVNLVNFEELDYTTIIALSEEKMTGILAKAWDPEKCSDKRSVRIIEVNFNVNSIETVFTAIDAMTSELDAISGGAIFQRMMEVTTSLTLSVIKKIPANVIGAANTTLLESFKSCGAPEIDCMKALCKKRKGEFGGVKANLLSSQLIQVLETAAGGQDFSSILLPTEVSLMDGACFRGITETHLSLLTSNKNLLKAICQAIAEDKRRVCDVQKDTRISIAKACFKYYDNDLDVATTVLTKAVADFSHLLLDIEEAADLIDSTLLQNGGITKIASCPHLIASSAARNKIITKLTSVADYNSISTWKYSDFGCWLPSLYGGATTDAQRSAIYKVITKNVNKVIKSINGAEVLEDISCLKPELSETLKAEVDLGRVEVLSHLTQAAYASTTPAVGKRRRSTVTSCSTAQAIPVDNLPAEMSVAVINAMADNEVATCLSYFGQVTGWSSEQASAILSKASTSNGWTDKSTLTSGNLITMGTIAYALTVAELNTMTIGDDSVSQLGSLHNWTDSQLQAIATRYLTAKSATANTLTSQQLKLMMHAVCGVYYVSQINPANYKTAANTLGKLNHATSSTCLKDLASLATHTSAYGQASGWTVTTYNNVGTVAAGLTGEELNNANKDSIDALGTLVAYIPPSELKKLSTAVLSYFNRQQVLSLTNDQLAVMNSEQRAVLESTSGVVITVAYSSAGGLVASFTIMVVTLMVGLVY